MTFSLSHLGQKMQKTTIPPKNDICSRRLGSHRPPLAHLLCPDQRWTGMTKTCPHVVKTGRIWKILNPFLLPGLIQVPDLTRTQDRYPNTRQSLCHSTDTLSKKSTFARRHSQKNLNCCFRVVSSPMEETVWRAKPILGTNFN